MAGDGDAWRLGFTLENLEFHVSAGYASGGWQVVGDSSVDLRPKAAQGSGVNLES